MQCLEHKELLVLRATKQSQLNNCAVNNSSLKLKNQVSAETKTKTIEIVTHMFPRVLTVHKNRHL